MTLQTTTTHGHIMTISCNKTEITIGQDFNNAFISVHKILSLSVILLKQLSLNIPLKFGTKKKLTTSQID